MSWGVYYTYKGYLSHLTKNELEDKLEELKNINEMYWQEILAYMAMTPPVMAKDAEGNEYPWAESIVLKIRQYRQDIEENDQLIARIQDCLEAMEENPEDVTEG